MQSENDYESVVQQRDALQKKLLAYEQAAKNEVALPEALKYAEIYGRAFICVDRSGSVHAVNPTQITLTILNETAPVLPKQPVKPVMFIDGDISSDDAEKLAAVIREFNEEERPLAKMARIIRDNPHPTNECDMPRAQPVIPKQPDNLDELMNAVEEVLRISDRDHDAWDRARAAMADIRNGVEAPAQPVIPEHQQPIAYIFKHPAGRLFWSLTDESNKWQADVIPVYAEPHELKIPPTI
ncbi:hypothetical protein NNX50_20265, partial [Hafnia paralvei]|nr:hypothetical protein [Hafnia paralvei]